MLKLFGPLAVCLLLLAACAPAPAERVSVVQTTEPPTYYPHPTGALWRYLPEGEAEDAPALVQRVEGPTVVDGERLIAWRTTGRGLETRTYRQYREDGVFIPRETGPGYVTTITPPIREWPRPGTLRVGLHWGGVAVASVTFTDAKEQEEVRLTYRFEVVDRRRVETSAGTFDVFVVAFESRSYGAEGQTEETLRQELWFTPFVGEIRTDSGLFLVASNLLPEAVPPEAAP
jgi:hypothetical protein